MFLWAREPHLGPQSSQKVVQSLHGSVRVDGAMLRVSEISPGLYKLWEVVTGLLVSVFSLGSVLGGRFGGFVGGCLPFARVGDVGLEWAQCVQNWLMIRETSFKSPVLLPSYLVCGRTP